MSSVSGLSGTTGTASTGSSTSTTSPLGVAGLISGINTNALVTAILAPDQQQVTDFQQQAQTVTAQQTAFDSIEAQVLSLQSTLSPLSSSQNSVFSARNATSSDTSLLNAAASSSAVPGVYNLTVNSLAAANEIASQGFDNTTSTITQGTLQLNVGKFSTTITVNSSNDTLQGLANAINNAGAGVTADIVNDGSGAGQQGYRLVLIANASGTANQIDISNNLGASGSGAVQPNFAAGTISNAIPAASFTGSSAVTSNAGAGYTGTSNDTYTFKVVQGGTVGTDNNIQLSYTNSTGSQTGTITLNAGDANTLENVAQGIQVQFGAGTLNAGDTFSIKAFVPTVQAATNASVTLGSGSGALTVTSATNQINSLIPGVTLSLVNSDPNTQVSVTVAADTASIQKDIDAFASAYNSAISSIAQETSYDSTTGQAGPLLGDWQTLQIQEQLTSSVNNAVVGASPLLNSLAALGITAQNNGQLNVNDAQISNVLAGNVPGVTLANVQQLFALTGSSTNAGIQFVTGGSATQSSTTPYTVNITQAAQQAVITAPNALAASTVIDNTNNTFSVSLNGLTSDTLTLAAGTYTQTQLAQAVQSAINGDTALDGDTVNVNVNNTNNLTITSSNYGSQATLGVLNGTALATLGFTGAANATGTDVAGSFTVNGNTEPATGSGQFLTGNTGNANTAGLELNVSLTSAQVGAGIQAPVTVSNGIAAQLSNLLSALSNPATGRFQQVDAAYKTSLTELNNEITAQNNYIQQRTTQLQNQFANMEQVLAGLQNASREISSLASDLGLSSSSSSSSSGSGSSSSSGSSSTSGSSTTG